MKKLNLDTLLVESFATVDTPEYLRGTVKGMQISLEVQSCLITCPNTCDPSCRNTGCVTACQGGSKLTMEEEIR